MNPSILQTEQNLFQWQSLLRWQHIPFQPELRIWGREINSQRTLPCPMQAFCKASCTFGVTHKSAGKNSCTGNRPFFTYSVCWGEVFFPALLSQAEAMFQQDSVLTHFPPFLLGVGFQLYLIQVTRAWGSCSIPPFWRDISFAFSTTPSWLETVEVVSGCCWAKQTCQEKLLCWCITGAHTVSPKRYCVRGAESKQDSWTRPTF